MFIKIVSSQEHNQPYKHTMYYYTFMTNTWILILISVHFCCYTYLLRSCLPDTSNTSPRWCRVMETVAKTASNKIAIKNAVVNAGKGCERRFITTLVVDVRARCTAARVTTATITFAVRSSSAGTVTALVLHPINSKASAADLSSIYYR